MLGDINACGEFIQTKKLEENLHRSSENNMW